MADGTVEPAQIRAGLLAMLDRVNPLHSFPCFNLKRKLHLFIYILFVLLFKP